MFGADYHRGRHMQLLLAGMKFDGLACDLVLFVGKHGKMALQWGFGSQREFYRRY